MVLMRRALRRIRYSMSASPHRARSEVVTACSRVGDRRRIQPLGYGRSTHRNPEPRRRRRIPPDGAPIPRLAARRRRAPTVLAPASRPCRPAPRPGLAMRIASTYFALRSPATPTAGASVGELERVEAARPQAQSQSDRAAGEPPQTLLRSPLERHRVPDQGARRRSRRVHGRQHRAPRPAGCRLRMPAGSTAADRRRR